MSTEGWIIVALSVAMLAIHILCEFRVHWARRDMLAWKALYQGEVKRNDYWRRIFTEHTVTTTKEES